MIMVDYYPRLVSLIFAMEIPFLFFFNCLIIGDISFQSPFVFVANVTNAFQDDLFQIQASIFLTLCNHKSNPDTSVPNVQ